jgi:tetratricopeptide (TPR) repeat protein
MVDFTGHPRDSDPLRGARRAVQEGRFGDAIEQLDGTPDTVRETPEWLLLSAMASWRLGDFIRSRAAAVQAGDRFRAAGDIDGAMRSENVAAAGAFALGELTDAERGFARALHLANELADDLMSARCANNLGNVAYYLARNVTALGFYRLATAGFEKVGFWKGLAEGWLNTTVATCDSGELDASREAGERAVGFAELSGDGRVFAQALAARSQTYVALGDVDLARVQALTALEFATANEDPLTQADALNILSMAARSREDFEQAADLGRRALAIARRVGHPWTEAEVERELGELYVRLGQGKDAARAFRAAAAAFTRGGSQVRARRMRSRAAAALR